MTTKITSFAGTSIPSTESLSSEVQLSTGSGVLQNLIVQEGVGSDSTVTIVQGGGNTAPSAMSPPPAGTQVIFAFRISAGAVLHLQAPIKFEGGLWVHINQSASFGDVSGGTAGSALFYANIS